MEIKLAKWVDDECFGELFEEVEQCDFCWIKKACHNRYKNRKPDEKKR